MIVGREQEAEADLVERAAGDFGRRVEVDSEPLEHVGRAAARGHRPIAVLGDRQARSGGDEGDRGRQVDRAGSVAAGAAAVGERIIGPLERRVGGAQRAGGADQLVGGLALDLEGDQQRGDRRLGQASGDELGKQGLALVPGKRASGEQGGQRLLGRFGLGWLRRRDGDLGVHEHGDDPGWRWGNKKPAGSGGLVERSD